MLIKTKNIDCASKSVFNTWKLPTGAADTSGDIYWSAVVYIKDTGEVWTHGKLYGGFFSNADSNKVSLTIGGTQKVLALDGHVQSYTTLTGSGTTADQVILSTGVANKWTLKTLGKNAFSNVDYLPIDGTAVAAEKVVNAMKFKYNGKDILSFDGSVARALNLIQGDNVSISGDSQGNVTIAADPGSDTVNTAGATNLINKKLFLIGAESQTTSPQTYSNQYVYVGTDNCLYSLGEKVLTKHQTIYNLDLQTLINNVTTKVTTFDPNAANNSFTLAQGTNITLTPDATNKKVTISSKDTTYDFYNLIFKQGESVIDTYKPTTSPSKSLKAGTNVAFTKSGDEITVTAVDTRNTTGATERLATKLFLTGALTQTDNPQTHTNSRVYVGTDNKLYSDGKVVSTSDHTHNYAGATSPGGPALKVDLNPSGLLDATYGSYGGILQDANKGPISDSWSNRIKILHNNSTGYYTELAQNFTGTAGLWHRRNVAGAVSEWTPVIDKANFRTYLDSTYVIRGNDPNILTNYVRYSIASGLTMNWEWGNATPTHIWGAKASDSSKAYVFNGDNIRAFANAVNRAGDTMTGTLKVTEIQSTGGNGLVMYSGTTYTYLGMQAGTTYIRSGATDLQHRYNGTDYKIWDARNLVGLRTEHSHNTINHIDNRETASTPQEHSAGLWLDFKANAKAGLTDGGTYTGLLTVRKYGSTSDWSGGKAAQLGFTDNSNVWVRFGTGTAWEAWKQIATTGWADGKFLPLAGGTMTGSITISTDSVLQWSRNTDYAKIHFKNTGDGDADSYMGFETGDNGNEYFKFSGKNGSTVTQWMSIKAGGVTAPAFIKSGSSAAYVLLGDGGHKALDLLIQVDRAGSINNRGNEGTNQVWFDYNFGGSGIVGSAISFTGLNSYATQICANYTGGNVIGFRTYNGDTRAWNPVKTLWHSGNLTPSNYVLKTGDTMTGDLLLSQPSTTGIRQVRMTCGDNDYGRVAVGGTATNAGWMEIATADDGNEPIYVRQYTGVFTTLSRTLTLLDASGNTSMPGTASASTFTTGGRYVTSYASGTWINSVSNAALTVNMSSNGYGGIWCAPVKSGRVTMSVYPSSNNNVYLGYVSATQISAGTNSFSRSTSWNADNGFWYAEGFYKNGSGDSNVLLGGGGHTALSTLYTTHNHFERTDIDPNSITAGPRTYESTNTANRPDTNSWHQYTTMGTGDSGYCHQLSYAYAGGTNIYHRVKNAGTWGSWFTILDSSNYSGILDDRYVNATGDTMTGRLTIQSSAMNGTYNGLLVGDDCYIGDCNIGNTIGLMGSTNNNAGMVKFGKGGYQFGYNGSKHYVSGTGVFSNLNADLLDGVHNGNVTANYYNANGQQTLNLNNLNANTWYPCVMAAHPSNITPIRVTFTDALSGHKPSWSTHSYGFSFQFDFEWIGGGWGTIPWYLRVYRYAAQHGGENACYGLEQRNNRSALVLYLRGGTSYYYRTTDGRSFTVYSANTNIGDATNPDYVAPRTSKLNDCYLQEASSRYGTCYRATYADQVTNADTVDGQHASAFSYKSWWHWSGQGGQPTWLWGGNSENKYYVYNPSNFNVNSAQYARKVRGEYTGSGGQLNPDAIGRNYVGFRMMNTRVGTNNNYKDWIISDCYGYDDVGGAVAFGMNRQALGAYLMGSDSDRASWSRKGEFWGTWNLDPVNKTLLKKTRVPGEVIDFYVYRVGSYYATNTDYTTFKNQLFDSDGRGKSSVTYYATYGNSYTVDLSDFVLCYGNMTGYSNGAYMAGAGETEANRVGYSAGANSKTITGYQMPRHTHWFAYHRGDNANDRDHFGPNSAQGDSPNGISAAGQGGNWHSGYSGRGDAIDFRPRTVFVFKMIYAPKTW